MTGFQLSPSSGRPMSSSVRTQRIPNQVTAISIFDRVGPTAYQDMGTVSGGREGRRRRGADARKKSF